MKAFIDVVELEAEDVVLTSTCTSDTDPCPTDCPTDFVPPCDTEL